MIHSLISENRFQVSLFKVSFLAVIYNIVIYFSKKIGVEGDGRGHELSALIEATIQSITIILYDY